MLMIVCAARRAILARKHKRTRQACVLSWQDNTKRQVLRIVYGLRKEPV